MLILEAKLQMISLVKMAIDQSTLKSAVLFESCLFLNNGDGTFEIIKLPIIAQVSPVRDILVRDFNLDGSMDLVTCRKRLYRKTIPGPL